MTADILILLFIVSPIIGLIIYLWKINGRVKSDGNRYMFFKVRDDLIMLVAEGYLREDDFLYQEYCKMTNRLINNTEIFTLKNIITGLSKLDKEKLGKDRFLERIEKELDQADEKVVEVVLATSFTIEGEATAHYISDMAARHQVMTTRIAHGVPLGGELEYIDSGTLAHAFSGRQRFDS